MQRFTICFFLLAVLCSADAGQMSGLPSPPSFLLKEIRQDGQPYREFACDSMHRLTAVTAYSDGNPYETYSYDSCGQLSKRFYTGFEETYRYDVDGALVSMTGYYPATDKTWSENYRRGPDGAIIDATTFYNGDTLGYVLYKYDSRGNTIERSEYREDSMLSYQEKCTFDSLQNPIQLSFPFDMLKKNNIVSYYYYSAIMSSPPPQYTRSFHYDASGLPVSEVRVRTYPNDTLFFEYIYDKPTVKTIRQPSVKKPLRISISTGARRSSVVISLNLTDAAVTSISLFDLSGRRVALLLRPTMYSAGNHRIPLFLNEYDFPRAGGASICVVKADGIVESFKVPVIK